MSCTWMKLRMPHGATLQRWFQLSERCSSAEGSVPGSGNISLDDLRVGRRNFLLFARLFPLISWPCWAFFAAGNGLDQRLLEPVGGV